MWCLKVVLPLLLEELYYGAAAAATASQLPEQSTATPTATIKPSTPAPSVNNLKWIIIICALIAVTLVLLLAAWRIHVCRRKKKVAAPPPEAVSPRQTEKEELVKETGPVAKREPKPGRSPTYQEMLDATPPSEPSPPTEWIE